MSVKIRRINSLCALCGGRLRRTAITFDARREEKLYIFQDVPADVCRSCEEAWIAGEVSQLMDEAIQKHRKPKKYEKVPVFSLAELSKA